GARFWTLPGTIFWCMVMPHSPAANSLLKKGTVPAASVDSLAVDRSLERDGPVFQQAATIARRLTLSGRVQGLGVRPAGAGLAAECCVAGSVSNVLRGIQITVEGEAGRVDAFQQRLKNCLPGGARADAMSIDEIPVAGHTRFEIVQACEEGPLCTEVPQDLA